MARKFSVEAVLDAKDRASPIIGQAARSVRTLSQVLGQFVKFNVDAVPVVGRLVSSLGRLRVALGVGLLGAAAATVAGLVALYQNLRDGVEAFAEAQRAAGRFEASLRSAGEFSAQARRQGIEFANAMQSSTEATSSQVLSLLALARSFGAAGEEAEKLTATALDFAEGAQLNAEEALRRLGRALQGSAADVANFAPEIRNLTQEQLRLGAATDLIAEKFRGQAAAAITTYQGAVQNLENAQKRLDEAQGSLVVGSGALVESIRLQARLTEELAKETENSSGLFERLALGWQNLSLIGTGLELLFTRILNRYDDLARRLQQSLGFDTPAERAAEAAAGLRAEFRRLVLESEDLSLNLRTLTETLGSEERAFEALFQAHQRELELTREHAAAAELLDVTLRRLGLRTLVQVERELAETVAAQERVERAFRAGVIGAAAYEAATEQLALEQEALQAVLDGTAESVDAYKLEVLEARAAQEAARASTDALKGSTDELRQSQDAVTRATVTSTRAYADQASQVALTASAFDKLVESQGQAAAVAAALAGGAQLELGGTRLSFGGPGRGGRIVDPRLGDRGGLFPGLSGATYVVPLAGDEVT